MDFEKGTQLKGYIQREIKNVPMHSNYGYNYYFCRKFLERLYENNPETFVLKGSFSQFVNLGKIARPITDIDMATSVHMEEANDMILSLISSNKSIKFIEKQKFVTTNATINYRLLCKLDNIEHLITVDLRKEEQNSFQSKDMPLLFSKDKAFKTNVISIEEHLANKIYIAFLNLQLNLKLGKEFRRFKDFYDIYNILALGNIDIEKLSTFLYKKISSDNFLNQYDLNGNLFSTKFVTDNIKTWEDDAKKYEFKNAVTFKETLDVTNEIISKIK